MGKKKEKNDPFEMLKLDIQYRDRQLASEIAMHNAEMAYQQKRMEMVDLPGLEEDKHQFALNYALETAKLDFTKEMGMREFGETQRQFDLSHELDLKRLALDTNAQDFDQRIRSGQFALDESSVTGFYNGQPTMGKLQMEAGLTGMYNGKPTFEREQWDVSNQQFQQEFGLKQADMFLNAPRGPADYNAYINRLTGMQNAGYNLPGAVSDLMHGRPGAGATTGAMQGAMPMSNTEFAANTIYGNQGGGSMFAAAAGGQQPGQPNAVGYGTGAPATGTPMAGMNPTGGIRGGSDVNFRDWQRLSPVTQQYVSGYAEENLGQPAEDFVWGIAQGAPAMQQAKTGKRGVF